MHTVALLLRTATLLGLLALPLAAQTGVNVTPAVEFGPQPAGTEVLSTEGTVVLEAVPIELTTLTVQDPAWDPAKFIATGPLVNEGTRLSNLSVRALLAHNDPPVIIGASIAGSDALPVLIRAIGPTLLQHQVPTALTVAPRLQAFRGQELVAASNLLPPQAVALAERIGTFAAKSPEAPLANGDAALVGLPRAGTLTAHMSTPGRGIALLELYDAPTASTASRFVNFSARAQVGTGADVMVLGFSISGPGTKTLLLRGVGPSLAPFGLTRHLANPYIELFSGSQRVAANDGWQTGTLLETAQLTDAMNASGAFPLTSDLDAALIVTLPAGSYTLHVRAAATPASNIVPGSVALAEVYELPSAFAATFQAARSVNATGLALFGKLAGSANLALSPYSIEAAFALAYTGAAGDTRSEMARVFGFPTDNSALLDGFKAIRISLEKAAADSIEIARIRSTPTQPITPITWAEANRLYGQDGYPFVPAFLDQLQTGWDSPLVPMNFATSPDAAREAINAWVAEVTRDRIQNLLPREAVDTLTRFVLVNALYFKGRWNQPFHPELTVPKPFTLADGSPVDVPTMHERLAIGYEAKDGAEVVVLPYIGKQLQFLVVMPQIGHTPAGYAAKLTPQHFERWANLSTTSPAQVDLRMPKFKLAAGSLPLAAPLQELGLQQPFLPRLADFTGIATDRDLHLQSIYHRVFIAVDESGTEAAAATAIIGGTTSVPPAVPVVNIDRPFLFAIQDRTTGVCLFFGQVTDPR